MNSVLLALAAAVFACSSEPAWHPGQPLKVQVGSVFAQGTSVRDHYSGETAQVDASGAVTLHPAASSVVLLEAASSGPASFTWPNATVYFAVTDRFFNGNPGNDQSYGRKPDGQSEVGTWHGGDFAGLTQKLPYLASLGVTALWISPVVEQVHGWVGGGNGDFKYYGYHGYWALDFTQIDQNFGTQAELQALIDGAHQLGIRVLLDVVMNHPGYATGEDLIAVLPQVFTDQTGANFRAFEASNPSNWLGWNNTVDYKSSAWSNWWSPGWIRAGLGPPGMYDPGGSDDLTRSVAFLPDFKTENPTAVAAPPFFASKTGTGVATIPGAAVRDYLVKWHTDWVRKLGVDGFRCDTAKNVDLPSWKALKTAGTAALGDWKSANPTRKLDDAPFWMTAEVFPHGVTKDAYFTEGGFDSVLNFDFQPAVLSLVQGKPTPEQIAAALDPVYASMAGMISTDPSFDVLTYLSSHDTRLFFDAIKNDSAGQMQAGAALLLAPGGVQIFYGDESGRKIGPGLSDPVQGTRSDMNWSATDSTILAHWQKLGDFRRSHAAVGGGTHAKLSTPANTYGFTRKKGADGVAIVWTGAK